MSSSTQVGRIGWIDMTTADAPAVRDFYQAVVGWDAEDVQMDGYADFMMKPSGEAEGVAGICHARGSNAELPPGWLIYIVVDDVERSSAACKHHGGKVLVEPRGLAGGRFCVIEDPSGAVAALYQP